MSNAQAIRQQTAGKSHLRGKNQVFRQVTNGRQLSIPSVCLGLSIRISFYSRNHFFGGQRNNVYLLWFVTKEKGPYPPPVRLSSSSQNVTLMNGGNPKGGGSAPQPNASFPHLNRESSLWFSTTAKMPEFSTASNEFGIEISQSLSKLSGEIDLLVNYFWLNALNWWTGSYQRVVFAWKSRWNVGCISFRGGCFYSFPSGRLLLSEFSDLINEAALVTSYSLSLHFSFKTWMFE